MLKCCTHRSTAKDSTPFNFSEHMKTLNNLNSGYAASVSEVTSNVSSMGGMGRFKESENDRTNYMTATKEFSIRPSGWQNRSVSPLETSKKHKNPHPDAGNASISSIW